MSKSIPTTQSSLLTPCSSAKLNYFITRFFYDQETAEHIWRLLFHENVDVDDFHRHVELYRSRVNAKQFTNYIKNNLTTDQAVHLLLESSRILTEEIEKNEQKPFNE